MKITKDNLIPVMIDKMLEPYGKSYAWVVENQLIDGVSWFDYYTWTEAEERDFKIWAVRVIKRALRCSSEKAISEYGWFSLMYGLKTRNI